MVFLHIKQQMPGCNFGAYMTNDFRSLVNSIGWTYWWDLDYNIENRRISPKDYVMLQSYVMARAGIDVGGGVVDSKTFTNIPKELRKFLKYRVAVKPCEIPASMAIRDLANIT